MRSRLRLAIVAAVGVSFPSGVLLNPIDSFFTYYPFLMESSSFDNLFEVKESSMSADHIQDYCYSVALLDGNHWGCPSFPFRGALGGAHRSHPCALESAHRPPTVGRLGPYGVPIVSRPWGPWGYTIRPPSVLLCMARNKRIPLACSFRSILTHSIFQL